MASFVLNMQATSGVPKSSPSKTAPLAGSPHASRAIGSAMRSKPEIPATPCHRVVASNGALAGYRAGQEIITKRKILVDEGVVFKGKKVDLAVSQWKT